jgi:hypothetical protein
MRQGYDHPEPGTIHIARKRGGPGVPATYHVRVGKIHITRRHINTDAPFRVCAICGHPYDHNGTPHRKGPTRRGESLTGPDGLMYIYDGAVWIQR